MKKLLIVLTLVLVSAMAVAQDTTAETPKVTTAQMAQAQQSAEAAVVNAISALINYAAVSKDYSQQGFDALTAAITADRQAIAQLQEQLVALQAANGACSGAGVICNLGAHCSPTECTLEFDTGVLAQAKAIWGLSRGALTYPMSNWTSEFSLHHTLVISGLAPDTTYYVNAYAKDVNNNQLPAAGIVVMTMQ